MTKDEHKGLLLDRGFRVCSPLYSARLSSDIETFICVVIC